ncbi:MAG: RluA family pseudouridine synthase [Acidobacteria bacterium]|nr:RluA family pseudouridine synthase [Acidobacteriota bacterium]MCA1640821.1 RluA family pseudouridine synthase [Acidobacteriota bacterium]
MGEESTQTELAGGASFAEPDAETLAFTVEEADAGARLDAFLAARVPHFSRTRLKQSIDEGEVLVGGRVEKPSYRLHAGEAVELETPEPPANNFEPEDIPLDIVYEDDSIVVVNKPAGLVVHPAAGVPSGTLANALAYRLRNADCGLRIEEDAEGARLGTDDDERHQANPQSEICIPQSKNPQSAFRNPQFPRPGIVHRLDRDTSGLIVAAKTEAARENLSEQFRAREVVKYYVALVHGATKEERGRIEEPIGRDPRNRTRMAVVRTGRRALSLWRVRRRFTRFTLLDVEIKTGRTHQIRVHLTWMKHPVVGDETYGAGRDKQIVDPRARTAVARLGRQFLHAERLGLRHPRTGEFMKFRAPLPPDLEAVLDALAEPEG